MEDKSGIRQFNGLDFSDWKFRMEMLFKEKMLWNWVVRERTQLEQTASNHEESEAKAQNLIVRHLAPTHIEYVKNKRCAHLMWKNLNDVFERQSITNKIIIKKALM